MRVIDQLKSAWWATTAHKARALSQIASLSAGVAAVVFSAAILAGFSIQIDRLAFGDYARALVIRENAYALDANGGPTSSHRQLLTERLPGVESFAGWARGYALVSLAEGHVTLPVFGAVGDYQRELDTPLVSGRYLREAEMNSSSRSCLVGAGVGVELKRPRLLGATLRVNGVACEVVGILGEPSSRPAGRFYDAIIAPFPTARRYFLSTSDVAPNEFDWLTLFLHSGESVQDARIETDRMLRKARGVPLSRPSPFAYDDPSAPRREQAAQQMMVSRLLFTLTGVALVASLIGYGAVASSATTVRTREIALRLTVGAIPSDITRQFLVEHGIIGAMGGAIGLLIGLVLGMIASTLWAWPFDPSISVAALALTLGVGTGLVLGSVMARRAAGASPALAARF